MEMEEIKSLDGQSTCMPLHAARKPYVQLDCLAAHDVSGMLKGVGGRETCSVRAEHLGATGGLQWYGQRKESWSRTELNGGWLTVIEPLGFVKQ